MRKLVLPLMLLASTSVFADGIDVKSFRYVGPFSVQQPVMMDSTNVNSKKYELKSVLDSQIDLKSVEKGSVVSEPVINGKDAALHMLGFTISNTVFTKPEIKVDCKSDYAIYVDGKRETGGNPSLQPAVHNVVIKLLSTDKTENDTIKVSVNGERFTIGEMGGADKRTFTLQDVMDATTYSTCVVSPDGKWMISGTYRLMSNNTDKREYYLWNLATGKKSKVYSNQWMPRTSKYLISRKDAGQQNYTLYAYDPATEAETILTECLPNNVFTMSPTEDYIIYSKSEEGPKEAKDVYEVRTPDDRQPGWRNRSNLYKLDLKSGIVTPLTYGHNNVSLNDISADGKTLLISKSEYDPKGMRPTYFTSLYTLDLATMKLTPVVTRDGFISHGLFSPDAKQIIVGGSPEAFGGVGLNVAEGQTASTYDYQLFLINLDNPSKVIPVTKDFNPSVGSTVWSKVDGMVYFSAEDKDCKHLFRLNPKTLKIQQIAIPEDLIDRYYVANNAPVIGWYGESATNADRLYTLNTKTLKHTLLEDMSKTQLEGIDLGECHPFTWVNPEGDSICCRYYLPPHFDKNKQYPVVVNYYGGCSPTSRSFGGRYSSQAYSALGYIVLVINPRGATGFGQKWSAAHVNTAGKGVAEDIIGAVKAFTAQHSYVNAKKIGCIGASYGGFMTQYLQTQTDIFAAAVSHAGISDHTSYWGEGYWGYSYSQTSMANSYPWTRKDLYVDQSPLYNADKIHTPLLFVHGTGDTNVPVGESIQMYTALKLLNRPTAMVLVEGENHWIMNYDKRIKWQNTIWAWFAKYLQDDDSWWKEMYSDKDL